MATTTLTTAQLTGKIEVLEKDVEKHDEWIEGNGKPGAKTRLTLLEDRQADLIKRLEKLTGLLTGLVVSIVTGIVLYFFTGLLPRIIGAIGAP